jgi:uncharacterized protein YjbJ (UPF0337 family)
MNWDQVEGKWKQLQGKAKEKWGQLTDDDFDVIRGQHQQLVGKIQERYGVAKEVAIQQADEFLASLNANPPEAGPDASDDSDDEETGEIARPQKVSRPATTGR